MLRRNSRAYRFTLLGASFLALGGAGYLVYSFFAQKEAKADLLKNAELAYEQGKQAPDAQAAVKSFDEANKLTNKAFDVLEEEKKGVKNPGADKEMEWRERRGKLLWLKAQILRDISYANAAQEGNPIREIPDSISGEMIRPFFQLPDSTRDDAIRCVQEAGAILSKNVPLQREWLRMELNFGTRDIAKIERIARNLIQSDEEDVRALSILADIDFKQYQEGKADENGNPGFAIVTPPAKRSRERIEAARGYLKTVKNAPRYPLWRTLLLEAQIQEWLEADARNFSRDKSPKEQPRLRELLLDPRTGALARAANKEAFTTLASPDIDGLIGLHTMAIDLAIDETRATMAQPQVIYQTLRALSSLATDLWGDKYAQGGLFAANVSMVMKARRVLGADTPPEWAAVRDRLESLGRQAVEANINNPTAYAGMAQLLNNEAFLEGKAGHTSAKKELEIRATFWIDQGLEIARRAKTPLSALVELHGIALEVLGSRGAKSEELQPHLDALEKVANEKRAAAILGLHKAVVFVRQGKLGRAKISLDEMLSNPEGKDLRPRALTLLANVLLNTQQAIRAVAVLKELQQSYGRLEDLNPAERAWMMEFLRDPQEIAVLVVVAELDTAVEKFNRYVKEDIAYGRNNLEPTQQAVIDSHEDGAREAWKKLTIGTDANLNARTTFVNYFVRMSEAARAVGWTDRAYLQSDRAAQTVNQLKSDYPRKVEVLRLEVLVALLPDRNIREDDAAFAQRKKTAEALIQAFITANPNDSAGRRFWAEWLIRTNRTTEALAYLNDASNFPGGRDEATTRMLAMSLVGNGNREQATDLLKQMPEDRSIETMLILTTANPVVRWQLAEKSVRKYENNGLFRLWEGEKLLAEGKYAEAARLYWQTSEFTRVQAAAQMGLQISLLRFADADPEKALQLTEQFSQEAPNDGTFYAIAAYTLLKKGELGSATDSWERTKSMYGALRAWEGAAGRGGIDGPNRVLFRVQFLLQANRSDLAWQELEPQAKSGNESILIQLIQLALESDEDSKLANAVNYVSLLREKRGNDTIVKFLDAQLLARMGDRDRAIGILEGILDQSPRYEIAYPVLIKLLNERRQTDKSAIWTERWARLAPENPIPVMEEIRQKIAAGKVSDARDQATAFTIEAIDRVNKLRGEPTDPELQKFKKESLRLAQIGADLILAQTWQEAGQLDAADQYLTDCLKADPANISALLLKAQVASHRKDWPKARAIYEEILKLDKNNYIARANLAWLLAEHLDQPAEALKLVREGRTISYTGKVAGVERLTPDYLDVMGTVYLQAARKAAGNNLFVEMRDIFDAACHRYPADPRAFLHLGDAYAGLAVGDLAKNAYQESLKLAQAGKGPISAPDRKELIQKITRRIQGT